LFEEADGKLDFQGAGLGAECLGHGLVLRRTFGLHVARHPEEFPADRRSVLGPEALTELPDSVEAALLCKFVVGIRIAFFESGEYRHAEDGAAGQALPADPAAESAGDPGSLFTGEAISVCKGQDDGLAAIIALKIESRGQVC